ncbi:hypothetical protein niasHS_010812 [Heterodera schachtii]|uniref:BPTI/Kunitz inhibitor domain-containing protein n=1 Tax=Heterodera schachtii TaxID=97005 RepID=A0ABD2J098_HETSC
MPLVLRFSLRNVSPVNVRPFLLISHFLLFLLLKCSVIADLPLELDPFLERLFETVECEAFLADASFLAVSTRDCPPSTCDFPRQLCMRPAASYKDESANQCRAIPEECLVAANGGVSPHPIHRPLPPLPRNFVLMLSCPFCLPLHNPRQLLPKLQIPSTNDEFPSTRNCDQFWFPGCRTAQTNDNLFDSLSECVAASQHCASRANSSEATFAPLLVPSPSVASPNSIPSPNQPQPPPPPPAENNGAPFGSLMGQWQNSQAGNFIRMITNTIREVRERGNGAGISPQGTTEGGGGEGIRWDANQLGGLIRSLGRRK